MKTGIELITEERERQIREEGYNKEHDLNHSDVDFVLAAISYLGCNFEGWDTESFWPWDKKHFKPKDLLKNLTRAGALIAAAIDRIQE